MRTMIEPKNDTNPLRSDEAVTRTMNAIRSLVRALRIDARAIEDAVGISLAQLVVLEKLREAPARSIVELSGRTATHASSVSVVVKRLVERGLVERSQGNADRRQVQFAVTDAGRAFLERAPRTVESYLVESLSQFDAQDAQRLATLLERWVATAGIDLVPINAA
jgi:DNA-binding MarR family transcriptional regulator